MGKKGGGRKGFVKAARVTQDDEHDVTTTTTAPDESTPVSAKANIEDASARFLKDPEPEAATSQAAPVTVEKGAGAKEESSKQAEPTNETASSSNETKGQLIQRHKRETKAHKEHTKKLGKKRKEEVEELDQAIETRHRKELEAWEAANKEDDAAATLVAPTAGLYELTIGTDEKSAKKPSKAQKRREQRAVEEAEREARIAEEQAGMGVSEREQEEESLRQLLQPLGLTVYEIPADGNCMYRAVQHQLVSSGVQEAPDYAQLREETASYMRAFPDEFKPFVLQEEETTDDPEAHFERYCQEVEETAAWGGQVELQALAQAIERHILVHAVDLPVVEMGTEYRGKSESLRVCYLRHAYGLGEHYNSVERVAVPT